MRLELGRAELVVAHLAGALPQRRMADLARSGGRSLSCATHDSAASASAVRRGCRAPGAARGSASPSRRPSRGGLRAGRGPRRAGSGGSSAIEGAASALSVWRYATSSLPVSRQRSMLCRAIVPSGFERENASRPTAAAAIARCARSCAGRSAPRRPATMSAKKPARPHANASAVSRRRVRPKALS